MVVIFFFLIHFKIELILVGGGNDLVVM